jgi:hypothetical protein
MILRSTNVRSALRSRQRGFILDPYRFGVAANPTALSIYNKIAGWWELDETSGTTINDAHTNALHGTVTAPYTLNETPLSANTGAAIALQASTSNISIPDNAALDITGAVSVMQWVKRDGPQSGAAFPKLMWKTGVNDVAGQGNYQLFYYRDTEEVWFRVTAGGSNSNVISPSMSNGTTYQYIGVRNGTTLNLYRNGSLDATAAGPSGSLDTGTGPLVSGYHATSNDPFNGWLGQQAVFNGALDATEVAYLYNSGAGISYAALKTAAGF